VIIPDVNVLVYAYNSRWARHAEVREWWADTLNGPNAVGMPWISLLGFIRITTHRGMIENPLPPGEALRLVRTWLAHPRVEILTPGERHAEILFGLLEQLGTAGNLTTDAHLAALAIEYQGELVSTDADFARFPKLRWFNPLARRR
jgi:toxin-antitoxin system PIN domain toxin